MQRLPTKLSMGIHVSGLVAGDESTDRRTDLEWQWRQGYQPQSWYCERYRDCGVEKKTPSEVNTVFAEQLAKTPSTEIDVDICAEADEFWSYVGDKSNQRWTWYALERDSGRILAYQNGKRTDAACEHLIEKLSIFPIRWYYTDNWQSYSKSIPASQHRIGKDNTWKIERTNLNFRTHLKRLHRKTICFSKSEAIHDNVIGMYINRYYYHGSYKNVA